MHEVNALMIILLKAGEKRGCGCVIPRNSYVQKRVITFNLFPMTDVIGLFIILLKNG